MNLRDLIKDDDAVSPVIGVILMVAITVILAAVIGTFVLGLGEQVQNTAPQASFGYDYSDESGADDTLTITHKSGDSIKDTQLDISYSGVTDESSSAKESGTVDWGTTGNDVTAGSTASAGSKIDGDVSFTGNNLELTDATVRVVWVGESGDTSAVLGEWTGPNA